ncbi:TPA: winged helix-turn-helix transcriptional regulator [Enterobacter cancerogenus]|nr:helix-turn-helix transcriptional regulator [Enterobacter hormaechei]
MNASEEKQVTENEIKKGDWIRCDVMAKGCPSRTVLQHLSSKWGSLILVALLSEKHRFSGLKRKIDGISEKILSQNLQLLECDGMVIRHSFNEIPPHVEYSLTTLGKDVAIKLQELILIIESSQEFFLNKKEEIK